MPEVTEPSTLSRLACRNRDVGLGEWVWAVERRGSVERQIPTWPELKPLIGFVTPRHPVRPGWRLHPPSRVSGLWHGAVPPYGVRTRRRWVGYEEILNRSRAASRAVEFHPRVLTDVSAGVPLEALPEVVDAVGSDAAVFIDGA